MLFITVALVAALVLVFYSRWRRPGAPNTTDLGQMSEQWLAELRASHSVA